MPFVVAAIFEAVRRELCQKKIGCEISHRLGSTSMQKNAVVKIKTTSGAHEKGVFCKRKCFKKGRALVKALATVSALAFVTLDLSCLLAYCAASQMLVCMPRSARVVALGNEHCP